MKNSFIVIGSNTGPRESHINRALRELERLCEIHKVSHIYESPDYLGKGRQYLNCVVEFCSSECENALISCLKEMEKEAGRTELSKERGEVPLDVDIVIWDGEIRRDADFNASFFKEGFNSIMNL